MNDRIRKRLDKLIKPPKEILISSEICLSRSMLSGFKSKDEVDLYIKRELVKKIVDILIESDVIDISTLETEGTTVIKATLKARSPYLTVDTDLII